MNNSKKAFGAIATTMCLYSAINTKVAIAAPIDIGKITVDNLNVRASNNTSSKVLGTLKKDSKVNILEKKGDWYKIDYNGQNAWVFSEYVSIEHNTSDSSTTINKNGVVNAISLNLRSGAGTNHSVVKTMPKGTSLLVIEKIGDWYKVDVNGTIGYVSCEYVTLGNNNDQNTDQANGENGFVTADNLNLRTGAGTNYGVIKVLSKDTKVTVTEKLSGWYKISVNGTSGYVSSQYISLGNENESNNNNSNNNQLNGKGGTVTVDSLNLRSGAGTNYNILKKLSKGSKVTIIETLNGWYKVNANGTSGYVSSEYVHLDGSDENKPPIIDSGNEQVIETGYVNTNGLFVRLGPATSYSHIGLLSYNTKVEILSENNGWYKINYNNGTGYVSKDFIDIKSSGNNENTDIDNINKIVIVTANALNVRTSPSTSGKIVGTLIYGTKGNISAHSNGWYKITAQGIEGWVHGDYVKVYDGSDNIDPVVKETPLIESRYTGTDIVNKAKEYIGVPYLWGGFTPLGFDCSGLVQYAYKHFGINISRTTYYQVHEGQIVKRENLIAGDLIFFTTNESDSNDISHVGIYIGDNQFIHAPGPGQLVKISSLNSSYYDSNYYISKRIIK